MGLGSFDWISGGGGDDKICGGLGQDHVSGDGGNDMVAGGPNRRYHIEQVYGGPGDDALYGGSGNDQVTGGPGNDSMHGMSGRDEVWYYDSAAPIVASLASGTAVGEGSDTLKGFEVLIGTRYNDSLTADAGRWRVVYGGPGDDTIRSGGAIRAQLVGDSGNDTLYGSANGGVGLDRLRGDQGDDHIEGNGGPGDFLVGGDGSDTMIGGSGDDFFSDRDNYYASSIDAIYGLGGSDTIRMRDRSGNDYADAGDGIDVCVYDVGDTVLNCP
jgi:Ca2+-binding RTX toxin-like protein